jgi:hypothetical protein
MRIIDPGHLYELDHLDGDKKELLRFVKREGPGYPGNVGHYEGTNMQEVTRSLIDRCFYTYNQVPCTETMAALQSYRNGLLFLELRAARRHGRLLDLRGQVALELLPVCKKCGHIGCGGACHP